MNKVPVIYSISVRSTRKKQVPAQSRGRGDHCKQSPALRLDGFGPIHLRGRLLGGFLVR